MYLLLLRLPLIQHFKKVFNLKFDISILTHAYKFQNTPNACNFQILHYSFTLVLQFNYKKNILEILPCYI